MATTIQDYRDWGAFIPAQLDDYPLSPYEFRVYVHLARLIGKSSYSESLSNMADRCHMSPATVRKALIKLERGRLISKQKQDSKLIWILTPPSEWLTAEEYQTLQENELDENNPTFIEVDVISDDNPLQLELIPTTAQANPSSSKSSALKKSQQLSEEHLEELLRIYNSNKPILWVQHEKLTTPHIKAFNFWYKQTGYQFDELAQRLADALAFCQKDSQFWGVQKMTLINLIRQTKTHLFDLSDKLRDGLERGIADLEPEKVRQAVELEKRQREWEQALDDF
jgi:hypothetical protein